MKDIPNDVIKKALDILPEKFPSWPPTPGEFKEICVSINGSSRFKWSNEVLKIENKQIISESDVQKVINEGAKVCKRLKEIYEDIGWMEMSGKFTRLKQVGRSYFSGIKDIDMFKKLLAFTNEEIKEIIIGG